jgi:hypothetical protein
MLSADRALELDARATIASIARPGTLASFGAAGHDDDHPLTRVEERASVFGDLWSVPPVAVDRDATVRGAIRSAGAIRLAHHATVTGAVKPFAPFPATKLTFTAMLPGPSAGDVHVAAGQTRTVKPGAFGRVRVAPGGTLLVGAGTYALASLELERGATLHLDERAGPVIVYLQGHLEVDRGSTLSVEGGTGTNFLLVALGHAGERDDEGEGDLELAIPWAGTVVAPHSKVTLRATPVPHQAQVFAQEIEVEERARVLFGGFDWNFFCPLGDSDGDGVPDCQDACSHDPKKTAPGICGCGVAEVDRDGDGIPDCLDLCPADPARTTPGQCGCSTAPRSAGSECTDGICSGLTGGALTCNGAGQCGDPDACSPDPGHCTPLVLGTSVYWVCTGPRSWAQASAACASVPGQALAELDGRQENAVVGSVLAARHLTGGAWLGGNDQGAVGTWRWATGTTPDGATFYAGGAPVSGAYTAWTPGNPGGSAGRCQAMLGDGSGAWRSEACSDPLAYVCRRSVGLSGHQDPPLTCADFSSNLYCPPAWTTCLPSDPSFPFFAAGGPAQAAARARFVSEVNTCLAAGCTSDGAPGCAQCVGAANVPPPGSRCEAFPSNRCGITAPHGTCATDADCPGGELCDFPPGCELCRPGLPCATCPRKVRQCGRPVVGCEGAQSASERCEEIDLCAPPGSAGNPDPRAGAGADLTTSTFDPGTAFTPPAPPAPQYPPDPACPTPPCNLGVANAWCSYDVPNPLGPQNPSDGKHGAAGGGGKVQFDFDPNLTLRFEATPLPLAEAKFNLVASASLTAGARFDFGSFGGAEVTVFDALLALKANRCRAWTSDSHAEVFGLDFLPTELSQFDTNPGTVNEAACNQALAEFQTTVDRAKKALKDAQELLRQYHSLQDAGMRLPDALCQQIAGDPPAGFPVGACATEQPEATINRFIDYYGQQLQGALARQAQLAFQELTVPVQQIPIFESDHEESQTLFNTTFLVGPIPVTVSVEAVEHYGLGGDLNFTFNPGALVLSSGAREEVAHAWGSAAPYANAGVSLFLGVGFDIGIASAEAGVEGIITLGNITVPVVAGVGIEVQPEPDLRPLPADLAGLAGPVPLVQPQQFLFLLKYDYGAQADLNQILAGSLNARVHVSFLFFSKTWRAKILDLGSGFSLPSLVLFQGQSGGVALGSAPWGRVQMPTPFVSLAKLPVPAALAGAAVPRVPFDSSSVEKLFFDSQCVCDQPGTPCFRNGDCCAAAPVCFPDPAAGGAKRCIQCRSEKQSCNTSADCCPGLLAGCYPTADLPGAPRQCTGCLSDGRACDPKSTTVLCCSAGAGGGCFQNAQTGAYQCQTIIR